MSGEGVRHSAAGVERRRARLLASLSLSLCATAGCGPNSLDRDGGSDSDSSSDTGSDTNSTPAECTARDLVLPETHSSRVIATTMFPASQGEADHATGSCGGGGVDHSYRLTSIKTSHYRLWVFSSEAPLTFHVHAGQSCHGPELYCATGTSLEFELMLEEGEAVTMVVDTESDLLIPEHGLPYNVGVSWASGPPQPCQADELHACIEAPVAALEACMESYSCGDFATTATCHDALKTGILSCVEEFCPDGPSDWTNDCVPACDDRQSSCIDEDGCDANTCAYEWHRCMHECGECNTVYFDFEYSGECELALPGPPIAMFPYQTSIAIAAQDYPISEPGLACGDPDATEVVWKSDSLLQLCDLACEAFATGGFAQVGYEFLYCT